MTFCLTSLFNTLNKNSITAKIFKLMWISFSFIVENFKKLQNTVYYSSMAAFDFSLYHEILCFVSMILFFFLDW